MPVLLPHKHGAWGPPSWSGAGDASQRAAVTGSCPPGPDQPRSPLHPGEEQRRCLGSGRQLRRQDQRPGGLLHDPPARRRSHSTGRPVRAPQPAVPPLPLPQQPLPFASPGHAPPSGSADGGVPAPMPTAKSCLLGASGFLQEGFLHPPACTQDPTWQTGASSEPSRSPPPLGGGGIRVRGAAHPSLSRHVPAFAASPLLYPFASTG